jgi:uncharacterized protein (TIGR02145 family)
MNLKFFKMKTPVLTLLAFVLLFAACEKDPFEASSGTFTDERDGRKYKWVKIGDQIWMAENLAYVPYVCAPDSQCGIWIYGYDGEGSYGTNYHTYGALYDWETAMEVCPEGWHLPSDQEWMELERFLGMEEDALYDMDDLFRGQVSGIGGKLKETGLTYWKAPNEGATNETGFSALPGGGKYNRYLSIKEVGCFWTSTKQDSNEAITRIYSSNHGGSGRYTNNLRDGLSVRCVKN